MPEPKTTADLVSPKEADLSSAKAERIGAAIAPKAARVRKMNRIRYFIGP
jgi:hypothetical protein